MAFTIENYEEEQSTRFMHPNIIGLSEISSELNNLYYSSWESQNDERALVQIAPMINVTNIHFRALMRTITKKAQLWTEMVVDNTLLYNLDNLKEHLGFNENEHPIVCQLGGSDPTSLAEAAILVQRYGYDGINLNVGCPSNKVATKGAFGATLMKTPELVRDIVYEIKRKVDLPISVKIRTGVDHFDSFSFLHSFVETVSSAGCNQFIVHARKAWLKGLDPKKNRKIPPLEYHKVYDLCQLFPQIKFTLNGGIKTVEEGMALLNGYIPHESLKTINEQKRNQEKVHNEVKKTVEDRGGEERKDDIHTSVDQTKNSYDKEEVKAKYKRRTSVEPKEKMYIKIENYEKSPLNGIMIGRMAMENTVGLAQIDKLFYKQKVPSTAYSRRTVLEAYIMYLEEHASLNNIASTFELLKPVLGILKGMPGHRIFRNKLDTYIRTYASKILSSQILEKAMFEVDQIAPGCLDLPLADQKAHYEYINNY